MKWRYVFVAILAVVVYKNLTTYPDKYYYPVGAKFAVTVIEVLDGLVSIFYLNFTSV